MIFSRRCIYVDPNMDVGLTLSGPTQSSYKVWHVKKFPLGPSMIFSSFEEAYAHAEMMRVAAGWKNLPNLPEVVRNQICDTERFGAFGVVASKKEDWDEEKIVLSRITVHARPNHEEKASLNQIGCPLEKRHAN